MASLDEYFKKRTEGFQTPTTTAAPEKPTDPASTYIDRISQTLAGKDPVVQNARQDASTKNAVGDYLANRQAKQEGVNAGYTPGTLQTQRTQDRYQAGANEAALGRDAMVNDLSRQRTDTAMLQSNQLRQEGNQEVETLINSVKDPVTQAYLRRIQAAGGDVKSALAGNLGGGMAPGAEVGGNAAPTLPTSPAAGAGPVDPATGLPISKTPAQLAQEAAEDEVSTFYPNLDKNSEEYKSLVRERTAGATEGELRVITQNNRDAKIKDAKTKASSNFSSLTPEETALLLENVKSYDPLSIPVGTGVFDAFKAVADNQVIQIGGKLYKPVDTIEWKQGKNRDFSVFQAPDGSYLYVDKSGKTTTTPIHQGTDTTARTRWLETFK